MNERMEGADAGILLSRSGLTQGAVRFAQAEHIALAR
jgi:hypothetical protein